MRTTVHRRTIRHEASTHDVSTAATEPDPSLVEWDWETLQRRRRRRVMLAAAVVAGVAIVAVGLMLVRTASGHYERGRRALDAEQYLVALQEFNAAHVLGIPYRDAEALAAEAREALDARYRQAAAERRVEEAVVRLVQRAASSLKAGDAAAVEQALMRARGRVPEGLLSTEATTLALLDELAVGVREAGRSALADGRWTAAASYASALLAIDPDDAAARRLSERAASAIALQRDLDRARAAADRGEWRAALRLAQRVLERWPGFPGAAALVERARAALAPKPTPSPTSGGVTSTPPPPPPPPPPP